jgi:hypothetical protein
MAGDLTEEARARGAVWFWWAVMLTASRQVGHEMVSDRRSMAKFALRGWLLEIAAAFLFAAMVSLAGTFVGSASPFWTWVWVVSVVADYQVGRWLAQSAPRREMAATISFTMTWLLLVVAAAVAHAHGYGLRGMHVTFPPVLYPLLKLIALFCGAAFARRRYLSRQRMSPGAYCA